MYPVQWQQRGYDLLWYSLKAKPWLQRPAVTHPQADFLLSDLFSHNLSHIFVPPCREKLTTSPPTSPKVRNPGVASTMRPLWPAPGGVSRTARVRWTNQKVWFWSWEVNISLRLQLLLSLWTSAPKRQSGLSAQVCVWPSQGLLQDKAPDVIPEGNSVWAPKVHRRDVGQTMKCQIVFFLCWFGLFC